MRLIGVSLFCLFVSDTDYPEISFISSARVSFVSKLLKMQFHHPQEKNYCLRNKKGN